MSDLWQRLEVLGQAGLTVSVCVGPSGSHPCRWSVLVRSRDGEEFDQPYAAGGYEHAVWIAEYESEKRGWWKP
jgi:hypothetical protein